MKISVGVFFGGRSVEHEVSVISALQAIHTLDKDKYRVVPIYMSKDGKWYTGKELLSIDNFKRLDNLLEKSTEIYMTPAHEDFGIFKKETGFLEKPQIDNIDLAFPILHGTYGEDGALQGFFELKGLPYVGCDVLSSAVGMDKIMMKMVLRDQGLPIVDFHWFLDREWYRDKDVIIEEIEKLGYPLIVKPANLGSSVGISKAANRDELITAIELASSFSQRLLAEKMVKDLKEINCSVIGYSTNLEASVCEEPLKSDDILSYKDKYLSDSSGSKGMSGTKRKIPADLPLEMSQRIQQLAKDTFRILGCAGVSRIDFLIDNDTNEVFVNEINTIPGSLSFYLWEPSNKAFEPMLEELIDQAFKRRRETGNLVTSFDSNIFQMDIDSSKLGEG